MNTLPEYNLDKTKQNKTSSRAGSRLQCSCTVFVDLNSPWSCDRWTGFTSTQPTLESTSRKQHDNNDDDDDAPKSPQTCLFLGVPWITNN